MTETINPESQWWGLSYPETFSYVANAEAVSRESDGSFKHPDIDAFRRIKDDGLLLEEELLDRLTEGSRFMVESVDFVEVPAWSEGRKESRHNVVFGHLNITRTDGTIAALEVAIKPFLQWRSEGSNELAATLVMPTATGIQGFETLGAMNTNGRLATITRFEPNVISLDNINWKLGLDATFYETIDAISALRKSALTLARIHQAGMTHNDSQIKNMAVAEIGGNTLEVRLIDLERARWRDLSDQNDQRSYLDEVRHDVSGLVGSILARGLWKNPDFGSKSEAVQAIFTDVYLSYLRHPANRTESYTEQLHEEVDDRVASVLDQI